MCTHQRFIYNQGKKLLVKCGHCPACLQESANRKARIIRTNTRPGMHCMFITLTYRNDSCPYIVLDDVIQKTRNNGNRFYIRVFRDSETKWVRTSSDYSTGRKVFLGTRQIGSVHVPLVDNPRDLKPSWDRVREMYWYNKEPRLRGRQPLYKLDFDPFDFEPLAKGPENKIGVIWHKDVQNFLKKLRQNLKRKFHVHNNFEYFLTSEYGPTTQRPHFHLLLWFPDSENFGTWKRAVASSWSYDDYRRTYRYTERAKDASSYLASYVSGNQRVAPLFRLSSSFRPHSSHSHFFGFRQNSFSLEKILAAYRQRNFTIFGKILSGLPTDERTLLFPKYVLRRFFPQIKGYSRLTCDALYQIYLRPENLSSYASHLPYYAKDVKLNQRLINRCFKRVSHLIDRFMYAEICSSIYTIYASNLLKLNLSNLSTPIQYWEYYDNISDLNISVYNDTLSDVLSHLPFIPSSDPNTFSHVLEYDKYLLDKFNKYDKSKKIKDLCYSSLTL